MKMTMNITLKQVRIHGQEYIWVASIMTIIQASFVIPMILVHTTTGVRALTSTKGAQSLTVPTTQSSVS